MVAPMATEQSGRGALGPHGLEELGLLEVRAGVLEEVHHWDEVEQAQKVWNPGSLEVWQGWEVWPSGFALQTSV